MAFGQSVVARHGSKKVFEWLGMDEEAAGWFAAGVGVGVALVSCDLHSHVAGEIVHQGTQKTIESVTVNINT